MAVSLPELPFQLEDLEPYVSRQTIQFHYGKHHRGYVDTLNELIKETPLDSENLEEIVFYAKDRLPKVFDNAAQAWNHTFFWNCLARKPDPPTRSLELRIARDFGSFNDFKLEFSARCKDLFGSGWVWLVLDSTGHLKIRPLSNAGTPITDNQVPLLTCDVWEHAYYLDYQHERKKYVEGFWQIVNWSNVDSLLSQETVRLAERQPAV